MERKLLRANLHNRFSKLALKLPRDAVKWTEMFVLSRINIDGRHLLSARLIVSWIEIVAPPCASDSSAALMNA